MLFRLMEDRWPARFRSKFLLLPGGFISIAWPGERSLRFGWATTVADIGPLVDHAAEAVDRLMSKQLVRSMNDRVDVLAIGVDIARDRVTNAYAELIALYDVNTRMVRFTGKSFPRTDQRTLVRVVDLATHFIATNDERVLALGCHDLNIFSPRGRGVQKT